MDKINLLFNQLIFEIFITQIIIGDPIDAINLKTYICP